MRASTAPPVDRRSSRYSCPSGYRSLDSCAARSASAVLPMPPGPEITTTGTADRDSRRSSQDTSAARSPRPTRSAAGGSWRGDRRRAGRRPGPLRERRLRRGDRSCVPAGDREVQGPQQGVRLAAGFLLQRLPVALVRAGHVGQMPAPVLGEHELLAQPPVGGVVAGDQHQLAQDALVLAAGQLQVEQPHRGPLVPLLQRDDLLAERVARHVRQRMRAPPQPQRLPQVTDLVLGAVLRPGFVRLQDQPLEQQGVDVGFGDAHLVPEPGMGLEVAALAHLGEQVADHLHALVELRFLHVVAAPRRADQLGLGHPPVRVDQESGQHDQGRTAR